MDVANSTHSTDKLMLLLTLSPAAACQGIPKGKKRVQLDGGAFECRTCGRRFMTFQALGGHRTSHKRPRVRADGLELLLGARPGKATRPMHHHCGTCGQVFATGQALGGHMRRHRPVATFSSGCSDQEDEGNGAGQLPTLFQFI